MQYSVSSFFAYISLMLFIACGTGDGKGDKVSQDSTAVQESWTEELCFLRVTGSESQDTPVDSMYVYLNIDRDTVTGTYSWLPAEKDKMLGTLEGTIAGREIKAILNYTAEGTSAREQKIMKIDGDTLYIKTGELVEKDGVWVLKNEPSSDYTITLTKIPCD